jgi:hypothetical protein
VFRRERERLQKLVLVPYRPFRNLSLGIGGVILIIAAAFGGFYAGSRYSSSVVGASPEEVARLRQTVRMYAEQFQAMRETTEVANHDRNIVLEATEQLRLENKSQLESISALQDQVATYKKLLSPSGMSVQGLAADRLDLRAAANGKINYRLLLVQTGNRTGSEITGALDVKVIGGGRSVDMPVGDNRFALIYFQSLSGEWQLPAGFQPERVDVLLKQNGKATPVKRSFRWEVAP